MQKTVLRKLTNVFAIFAICAVLGVFVKAQEENAATILGQVSDTTGAAIANATVVVVNTATGETRQAQSSSDGIYTVYPLRPGSYTVTVEQPGFKKSVVNVTLNAKDRRPIDIALEVGGATETVTVTSEPPLIQESPTGQTLVSGNQVVELPLNNRNFIRLLETVPGVSSDLDDEANFGLTSRASVSINGMRRNSVNYFIDGVSNTDVGSNITLLSTPTVDSIQEFKVLSSNYTAEVGRSGGGAVVIVTKGGGNEFHGTLYEFVRNDYFNANNFFNNRLGSRADGSPVAGVPKLRYNNFGGTISGPVYFLNFGEGGPTVYNGKNKTFFFFSEEVRRIKRAAADASSTVPSLAQRQGNFSSQLGAPLCRTPAGAVTTSCAAPNTPITAVDTAGNTIQIRQNQIFNPNNVPFANNIIPLSQIDPRALALLNGFPEPNNGTNGFTFSPVNINNTRQEVYRIDHNFNDNHKIFGRYTADLSATQEAGGLFTGIALPNVATTDTNVPGRVFGATYTSIFSSRFVNELAFNYSFNRITSDVIGRGRRSDYPGSQEIAEFYPENNNNAIPTIVIPGFSTLGSLQGFGIEYSNYVIRDTFTWSRGNHLFKFGGEISFENKSENANGLTQGRFDYSTLQTRGLVGTTAITGTGISFASFLLGRANAYQEALTDLKVDLLFGRREFFAQDTWKVLPNLTLDIGVRYQYFVPPYDRRDLIGSFDAALYSSSKVTCANTACSAITANSDRLNGIGIANSSSRFGRSIIEPDTNNFSPRVGLAWDPFKDGKTIVRAGYGLYYDQPAVGIFEVAQFSVPSFSPVASFTSGTTNASTITFSNPGAGSPPGTLPILNLNAIAPDFENPEIQQWSIGVQREVFKNAVVDVSYVGTKGDKLIRRRNVNFVTPTDVVNNLAATGVTQGTNIRPYLGYGSINYHETSARSRYHGLLTSFNYRLSRGFTITLSYTLSKTLTDSTNDRDPIDDPQNPFDPRADFAEARTSRRHIFSASYVYEIPFFRNSENAFLRLLLGGYQISGITNIESGAPIARVTIADTLGGQRGQYANLIGNPNGGLAGTIDPLTGLPFLFDPTAFSTPGIGEFGNAPRAFGFLPGRNQTNLALTKQFYFNKERTFYLQLRAESFNLFNNTQFTYPNTTQFPAAGTLPSAGPLTNTTFARPTGTRLPREFQFGIKMYF